MTVRYLALACLAACGQVANPSPGSDAGPAIDAAMASAYNGMLSQTPPSMFGGTPYCNYTITLKQLAIDLAILPSRQATSGHVQALEVEGTDASCPNPVIPPTIANFTLGSSSVGAAGTTLMFQGAVANNPMVSLVGTMTATGSQYTVVLTFHRTDQMAPLDWTVQTTVILSAQ
ncbi:MAG TPA: hypothetical protein VIX73_17710 [Kofleriaceae bacterium]|jgi:hypothetical protein